MSRIIVLGAGVCGLAAGMLLRRDGHEVTVLERDVDVVPESVDEAWERWSRRGVGQFRQPHLLVSRGRMMLEEVSRMSLSRSRLSAPLGFELLDLMPPSITDRTPRDGDDGCGQSPLAGPCSSKCCVERQRPNRASIPGPASLSASSS